MQPISTGDHLQPSEITMLPIIIYDENAVEHILSGKAISREIRGHLLVDAAVHMNLTDMLYPAKDELNIQPRDVEKEQIAEEENLTNLST